MRLARIEVEDLGNGKVACHIALHPSVPEAMGERLARAISAAFAGEVDPVSEPQEVEP